MLVLVLLFFARQVGLGHGPLGLLRGLVHLGADLAGQLLQVLLLLLSQAHQRPPNVPARLLQRGQRPLVLVLLAGAQVQRAGPHVLVLVLLLADGLDRETGPDLELAPVVGLFLAGLALEVVPLGLGPLVDVKVAQRDADLAEEVVDADERAVQGGENDLRGVAF